MLFQVKTFQQKTKFGTFFPDKKQKQRGLVNKQTNKYRINKSFQWEFEAFCQSISVSFTLTRNGLGHVTRLFSGLFLSQALGDCLAVKSNCCGLKQKHVGSMGVGFHRSLLKLAPIKQTFSTFRSQK